MAVAKRFGVLRLFGTALKVIAWIILVFAVLGAIGAVIATATATFASLVDAVPGGASLLAGGGFGVAVAALIFGAVYFVIFYALGELLHMQLAIEENTRLTAALLLDMHKASQPEEETSFDAEDVGFVGEPFES